MSIAEYKHALAPSSEDAGLARESSRTLASFASRFVRSPEHAARINLTVQADNNQPEVETVSIPAAAFRLLMDILNQMAQGNAVTIIPVHAELTTQEAAEILNVSRPFVIKLIDEGQLPCKKVGTHRRILLSDLLGYKQKIDADRSKTLDELAAQAQQLGMGY